MVFKNFNSSHKQAAFVWKKQVYSVDRVGVQNWIGIVNFH